VRVRPKFARLSLCHEQSVHSDVCGIDQMMQSGLVRSMELCNTSRTGVGLEYTSSVFLISAQDGSGVGRFAAAADLPCSG